MTEPRDDKPEESVEEQAVAEEQPAPVLVSEEEVQHRAARGISWWLAGTVIAFWVAVLGILFGMIHFSQSLWLASAFILMVGLVVTLVLYLAIMLESTAFYDRRVRFWLTISFADLLVLSVINLVNAMFGRDGAPGFTAVALIPILMFLLAIGVLVYALRAKARFIFLLAITILLLANLALANLIKPH